MKNKFFISVLVFFCISLQIWHAASLRIVASGENQVVKIFSSLADFNSNSNPISTLITDVNFEATYSYTTNTNQTVYILSEIDATIDEWWSSEYVLADGDENILSLWVWWDLSLLVNGLDEIKWEGFVTELHALALTWSGWISVADKSDIAARTRIELESNWGLLFQILDKIWEILSRVFSIKWDTQKIK